MVSCQVAENEENVKEEKIKERHISVPLLDRRPENIDCMCINNTHYIGTESSPIVVTMFYSTMMIGFFNLILNWYFPEAFSSYLSKNYTTV